MSPHRVYFKSPSGDQLHTSYPVKEMARNKFKICIITDEIKNTLVNIKKSALNVFFFRCGKEKTQVKTIPKLAIQQLWCIQIQKEK